MQAWMRTMVQGIGCWRRAVGMGRSRRCSHRDGALPLSQERKGVSIEPVKKKTRPTMKQEIHRPVVRKLKLVKTESPSK